MGGFFEFRKTCLADRPAKLSKEEQREWESNIGMRWKGLTEDQKGAHRKRERDKPDAQLDVESILTEKLKGVLRSLSCWETPVDPSLFSNKVRKILGLARDTFIGGFTRYAGTLRQVFQDAIFVTGKGLQA